MSNPVIIRVVAIIVAGVFFIASWVTTGSPDTAFLRFFSIAVFIASVVLVLWDKWGWRTRLAQLFRAVPTNIAGTWEATLTSHWIDPATTTAFEPKLVYVVIRQDFATVTVTLISEESISRSSLAAVVRNDDSWSVHYVYVNEPDYRRRIVSPIHHGSGVMQIVGRPAERISGKYWTDRDSKGQLSLNRRSAQRAEDFAGAEKLFDNVSSE